MTQLSSIPKDIAQVALDLEGTLVDLEKFHFRAFELALLALKIESPPDMIAAIPGAIGGGDPFIAHALARIHFKDLSETVQFEQGIRILNMKKTIFEELILGQTMKTRPLVIEVIEAILARGIKVALCSLTPMKRGMTILDQSGLRHLFPRDGIFFREDVKEPKPAPDIYLKAAGYAGIHPSEQMIFEDSVTGIKAACAAGSPAIAMPVPMFNQDESFIGNLRAAGAAHVFMDWGEVYRSETLNELFGEL